MLLSAALLVLRYPPGPPTPSAVPVRKRLPLPLATWGIARYLYAN